MRMVDWMAAMRRAAEIPLPATSPMAKARQFSESDRSRSNRRRPCGRLADALELEGLGEGDVLGEELILDFAGDLEFGFEAFLLLGDDDEAAEASVMVLKECVEFGELSLPLTGMR